MHNKTAERRHEVAGGRLNPLDMVRWIWQPDAPLTTSEKAVMTALVTNRNNGTGLCCPSQARLAAQTGLHRSTVNRALGRLVAKGIVRRTRRQFTSTLYELFPAGIPGQPSRSNDSPKPASVDPSPDVTLGAANGQEQDAEASALVQTVVEIGLRGERPADYARQFARAKRLLKMKPFGYWCDAAEAMQNLFPYSRGASWDVIGLGQKAHLALAQSKSDSLEVFDDNPDMPEWERRARMLAR